MVPSLENLIPIAVFAAITLGTWSVLGLVAARPKSAELRLKRLLDPRAVEVSQAKRQEQVQAKVAAAAGKLGKSLRPSNEQELGKIRIKLLNAGFRQEQAVAVFFGVKLILLLIALFARFSGRGHLSGDDPESLHGRGVRGRVRLLFARLPGRQTQEVAW